MFLLISFGVRLILRTPLSPVTSKTVPSRNFASFSLPRVPSVIGHCTVIDKAAILTLRQNEGTMGFSSLIGQAAPFLRWVEDLFTHEWERTKPWLP